MGLSSQLQLSCIWWTGANCEAGQRDGGAEPSPGEADGPDSPALNSPEQPPGSDGNERSGGRWKETFLMTPADGTPRDLDCLGAARAPPPHRSIRRGCVEDESESFMDVTRE
ncbi:hypothetical protein F25303_6633 [Fusarium sp. NRRL 25303]|nr:hypothetical protein F25303_6633 [Fusarium sp. NRRL 25303]